MVSLRGFTLEDYDVVSSLWARAGDGLGIGRSDARDEIAKKLERDPDLFLLAEDGGVVVGTVIGGYDGRRGLIYHLAVEQAYRRQGVGQMLMEEVEQRLRAKGCVKAYLLVKRGNEGVVHFYERRGWGEMEVTLRGKPL